MSKKTKRTLKRILLIAALAMLVVVLTGCGNMNSPVTKSSTNFWDRYVVYYFQQFILVMAKNWHLGVAWAIIVFTVIVRVILLPLMYFQSKSQKKQMQLQPEIKQLQQKYPGKDVDSRQKLNEETQKLYSEAGINPMLGCLPLLLQMPIMLALYQAIYRTPDLRVGSFIWMQLGQPDQYHILPIVAGLLTLLSSWLTMKATPQQGGIGMAMMGVSAIMITWFAWVTASAVSIYWVVSNLFQVGQTMLLQNPWQIQREMAAKEKEKKDKERRLRRAKRRALKKR
ncbi:MAG: membrane protein insertase YidC [Schleiferilactobacillus perolens]|uniref:Membrane protein insertase YidC n=2 Tax=Schleiferilactobacillus perolens TaxID=100468 RepID=A0A0R1MLX3_9LACO|nr:membrane insertase, YidC Oxa1 family domain protein [Schleiferilactobacillus perolens DSM 12744]